MKKRVLADYIRRMSPDIVEDELEQIVDALPVYSYPQGTVLIRQGEPAPVCYFILQGCLRMFFVDEEGHERTTEFFAEEQSATIFDSFRNGTPSPFSVECVEECLLLAGDLNSEQSMTDEIPALSEIIRNAMEYEFAGKQREHGSFKALSPEERYRHVLETRPGLAGRVPQHQLASYLGVAPESLSRIKNRLHRAACSATSASGPSRSE